MSSAASESLAGLRSSAVVVTVAVTGPAPAVTGSRATTTVRLAPGASVPSVHGAAARQASGPSAVTASGWASVRRTPVAGPDASLVTTSRAATGSPPTHAVGCPSSTRTATSATTVTRGGATTSTAASAVSFSASGSIIRDVTVARVTWLPAAPIARGTVTVYVASTGSVCGAVHCRPVAVAAQPAGTLTRCSPPPGSATSRSTPQAGEGPWLVAV